MKSQADLLVVHAAQVVTPRDPGAPLRGRRQNKLEVIEDGAVAIREQRIVAMGSTRELMRRFRGPTLDARGGVVTPGLVDAHTHLVFAGSREREFEMRNQGADYMAIAKAGGGILSTVDAVRRTSEAKLFRLAQARRRKMFEYGTTTAEVKSGYGLTLRDELKLLRVIHRLPGVVPTFLGAHEVPREYRGRRSAYVKQVLAMLPRVAKLARFCDVFCEAGVFTVDESRAILTEAKRLGIQPKLHAEEFANTGGARLAAELGAVTADHLMAVNPGDIRALADAGTVAVLLPGTSFFLGHGRYAPARKMIQAGVPVALGSDFNPGSSMSFSMPLMMSIACTQMKLTPAEALVAATLNAAYAVGARNIGSLEPGKQADLVVWDAPDYRFLAYHYGVNLAKLVIVAGRKIQ